MVIILAGELRGNQDNWETLDTFRYNNNASLFIGSYAPNEWEVFPLPNQIIQTHYLSDLFYNCSHQDVERYKHQYSNLFLTWEHFKNVIDGNEIIHCYNETQKLSKWCLLKVILELNPAN